MQKNMRIILTRLQSFIRQQMALYEIIQREHEYRNKNKLMYLQ